MRINHQIQSRIPSVIIADDHELIRMVLVLTLEAAGINIIETVSNGQEAIDSTLKNKPDVLILDVVMPELDGLAALATIKYLVPETKVIVLTFIAEPEYSFRANELGADAFFSKGVSPELLIRTVNALTSGQDLNIQLEENCKPAKPSIPNIHLSSEGPNMTIPQDLTNQETIVLSLLAMGYDNGLIIDQLCISKNTLKTHLRNVYSKLGVNDRTQAAVWALKSGIIGHIST